MRRSPDRRALLLVLLLVVLPPPGPSTPRAAAAAADDAPADAGDPLDNKMVTLWGTPILSRQLLPPPPRAAAAADDDRGGGGPNAAVRRTVLDLFAAFKASDRWSGSRSSSAASGLNEAFFAFQKAHFESTRTLVPALQRDPVVQSLLSALAQLVDRYLAAADPAGRHAHDNGAPPEHELFLWATVHTSCMAHLHHVHENSAVSGVYYVSAPPGSGDLILEDPRGAHPPFGLRHVVTPRPGLAVLFPAWLVHGVAPSCGLTADNPRISLSFNVVGDWKRTNDATALLFDMSDAGRASARGDRGDL